MTQIKDTAIEPFLDELASSAATPGGGSAAAIIGAMGAALVSMVCNLTIGKKKYAEVEGEMKDVLAKTEALRKKLTGMIEDDVKAFDAVMGAYGMPKETDADKAARDKAIQAALKLATDVPLGLRPRRARGDRPRRDRLRQGQSQRDLRRRRRRARRLCCTAKRRLECFHQRKNDYGQDFRRG